MKRDFEVIEASQDLVNSLVPFANDCYSEGITMYKRALDNPQQYLQSLIERSRATEQELLNGLLPSTTYYYLHNHEILGAIRLRRGTNFNVENVIGHIGYETSSLARNKGVASSLLMWTRER